jgi:hypothetical protein
MSKQTAVEWLVENYLPLKRGIELRHEHTLKVFEQAKAIEKQQIIDACNLQRNDYKGMPTYNTSGEQYYNEIYNK